MKYIIAAALFAVSITSAIFSAILSFEGLENTFPGIPYVGYIGGVIALTTVAISAATSQAKKQQQNNLFKVCAVLMASAIVLDFGANTTATTGEVDTRSVEYDQAVSAYTIANQTLNDTRRRIEKAEADLKTVLGENVEAAQMVLVASGQDIIVDGKRGPKTNKALAAFGRKLNTDLVALRAIESESGAIVAAGLPENSSTGDLMFAIILAAMLTILSSSTSFIASALLGGEEIDFDELETRIDHGLQNVTQIEEWLDQRTA